MNPAILGVIASKKKPAGGDPFYAQTVLILPGSDSGADGSSTITDASNSGRTITSNGNIVIDTDLSPFPGTKTVICDGTGDFASFTSFTLNQTEDWTVEVWAYVPTGSGTNWRLRNAGGSNLSYLSIGGAGTSAAIGSNQQANSSDEYSGTLTNDTWEFFAVSHTASTRLELYQGTSRVLNLASSREWPIEYVGRYVAVGPSSYDFTGNLYVRITKGAARYTGASITVPAEAFPES